MNQDLLAPPKLAVRHFANIIGAVGLLVILGGVVMALLSRLSPGEVAIRSLLVVAAGAGSVAMYGWVFRRSGRARPERMPYYHAAISLMGLGGFYLYLAIMFHGTGFGAGRAILWIVPLMLGMTLAVGGWGRRVGDSLHCPACEYEFNFAQADAPVRCPECSTPWLGRLHKGRRVRSPRMMAFGIGIALSGMLVMQPILWLNPMAKSLPTPVLYAALYSEPRTLYTTWQELAARPLGERWVRGMAERILSHRSRHQWDVGATVWFEAMITSARMPRDLEERYYREGLKAEIIAPQRVKAGEEFTVKIRVRRAVEGWGSKIGVMFAGYSVAGGSPVGKAPEAVWGYQLRPPVFSSHTDHFEQRLTIPTPGPHRLSATYWVVYQPSFWTIHWGAEGQPTRPPSAMWFEREDLDALIEAR